MSGDVLALLRYTRKPHPKTGRDFINASEKQDVTRDFACVALDWLAADHPDIQPILRKVEAGEALTGFERVAVGDLADNLEDLIAKAQAEPDSGEANIREEGS